MDYSMKRNPTWLIRNAQEAMLDRCVSYAKGSREPRVGPPRASVGSCYGPWFVARSEHWARRMIWC